MPDCSSAPAQDARTSVSPRPRIFRSSPDHLPAVILRREMKIRRFAFPLLAASFTTILFAQSAPTLSPTEKTIVAFIDASEQASNALLEKLVSINSGTHNLEGVRAVAEIMDRHLTEHDFKVQRSPMPQVERAGVLVAEQVHSLPRTRQMRQAHAVHWTHGYGV